VSRSSEPARRRPRRETTPGPSNAEIVQALNGIAHHLLLIEQVLGIMVINSQSPEPMPQELLSFVLSELGIDHQIVPTARKGEPMQ